MFGSNEPLISVIVPVYNGESCLADCIHSIEGQTYPNLEVIIVNDGSTDGTGSVCNKLLEKFGNVKVITMKDEGVSAARNAGMKIAEGDYLTFVDSDDRLQANMLKVLYDCIAETESDVAGCGFFIWKNEEEWKLHTDGRYADYSAEIPKVYEPAVYVREALLRGNSRCWSKLYRRSVVENICFKQGLSIGEDMLFLVDMLPFLNRIAEITYPGYGYYQNPEGAMKRKFIPSYMDQITCWELARERLLKIDSGLEAQITAILIMGIMLTVGKIADLSFSERQQQGIYVKVCHEKLKEAMRIAGAYQKLSGGYKIKVRLFQRLPKFYLMLYHYRGR